MIVVIPASCNISPTELRGIVGRALFGVREMMVVGITAVVPVTTVVAREMLVPRTELAATCLWARV